MTTWVETFSNGSSTPNDLTWTGSLVCSGGLGAVSSAANLIHTASEASATDGEVTAEYHDPSAYGRVSIAARVTGVNSCYVLQTNGSDIRLRHSGGTGTTIWNTAATVNVGDTLSLRFVGSAWTVKHNGSTIGSGTDTNHASGGFGCWSTQTWANLDNWTFDDLVAAVAAPVKPKLRRSPMSGNYHR
jgi:hypothetical protein